MLLQTLMSVVADASPPAPDYTPALIGLGGVMLGGIIQAGAQHSTLRHNRMMEVRANVSELAQVISSYTTVFVQAADVINPAREKLRADLQRDPEAELDLDEDYFERLASAFFDAYRDFLKLSIAVMHCSDYRVSEKASSLHLAVTAHHNEVAQLFTGSKGFATDEAKVIQAEINADVSILMSMVTPGWTERHLRFRSARRAERGIEKDRLKKSAR
jgi:hypothetical protein